MNSMNVHWTWNIWCANIPFDCDRWLCHASFVMMKLFFCSSFQCMFYEEFYSLKKEKLHVSRVKFFGWAKNSKKKKKTKNAIQMVITNFMWKIIDQTVLFAWPNINNKASPFICSDAALYPLVNITSFKNYVWCLLSYNAHLLNDADISILTDKIYILYQVW